MIYYFLFFSSDFTIYYIAIGILGIIVILETITLITIICIKYKLKCKCNFNTDTTPTPIELRVMHANLQAARDI